MEGNAVAAITPEVRCVSRSLSLWSKCGCASCTNRAYRIRKANEQGTYRRIPSERGLAALDKMLAKGYNGPAIASASGVRMHTAINWAVRRRRGETFDLGPVACLKLVQAGPPTEGRAYCWLATRKLRALSALGWAMADLIQLMDERGWHHTTKFTIGRVLSAATETAEVPLLAAIDKAYALLHMTPAPDNRWHTRIRTDARAAGWAPPLAWHNIADPDDRPEGVRPKPGVREPTRYSKAPEATVDPVAVARLMAGKREGFAPTRAEREAAVHKMRARGISDQEIERITGIGHLTDRYPRVVAESKKEVPA